MRIILFLILAAFSALLRFSNCQYGAKSIDKVVHILDTRIEEKSEETGCTIADILFVVDSTGSVKDDFHKHRGHVFDVVSQLDVTELNIGVVVYSSSLRQQIKIPLQTHADKEKLLTDIKRLPFFGGVTATGAALELAHEAVNRRDSGGPVHIVVITDGFSFDFVEEAASKLRQFTDGQIFAVGVATPLNEQELLAIAGSEDNVFIGPDAVQELLSRLKMKHCPVENVKKAVAQLSVRQPPSMTPQTVSAPCDNEQPKLQPSISVLIPTEVLTTNCSLDVLFVLDASGSVSSNRFKMELNLAANLVDSLNIRNRSGDRVAAIRFSDRGTAKVVIHFGDYTDRDSVREALLLTEFSGGTTATDDALHLALSVIESIRRPVRTQPVVVVFTDGFSQQNPKPGAQKLHAQNIPVYAVGINDRYPVDLLQLNVIAGRPDRVFKDKNIGKLFNDFNNVLRKC